MAWHVLKLGGSRPPQVQTLLVQQLVLLHSHLDVILIKLGVECLKRVKFNLSIALATFKTTELQVFHSLERFLHLIALSYIGLTDQFLYAALFSGKTEARQHEKVEIRRPEVVTTVQI